MQYQLGMILLICTYLYISCVVYTYYIYLYILFIIYIYVYYITYILFFLCFIKRRSYIKTETKVIFPTCEMGVI